ncbi:uncharacterized protein LOC119067851 [Bradysia coprophila]|uniref:uncharacterized protein LOC119067851 n=1 Tax=Bradysia coprophila TaxID=38358 RepID=UPI00187D7934|nr:uncharacterized protein LOC119067851 [Bradysia coprophila]
MGSLDKACIAGFLCRLCSEMHRTVIHIYGDKGRSLGLAQKINDYLPVTITPTDPLPKTICESCMGRVEQHHDLMVKMTKSRVHFAQLRQVRMQLHRYSQSTNSQSEASSVEISNRVPTNEVRRTSQSHNNDNQINDDDDDDASSNDSDENI